MNKKVTAKKDSRKSELARERERERERENP